MLFLITNKLVDNNLPENLFASYVIFYIWTNISYAGRIFVDKHINLRQRDVNDASEYTLFIRCEFFENTKNIWAKVAVSAVDSQSSYVKTELIKKQNSPESYIYSIPAPKSAITIAFWY